ncbi:hypothetical protein UA45_02680 [Morganella morganii]|uniref:Uncharacterized protein n=1 Tax=Morganella morganii TaxID=582 RepID=A0A0D8LAR5_MORMO|nr:hypothetical protein UA45_02680 [Morganella morganii]
MISLSQLSGDKKVNPIILNEFIFYIRKECKYLYAARPPLYFFIRNCLFLCDFVTAGRKMILTRRKTGSY